MSTRILGLTLIAFLAFSGIPASAHPSEEAHEDVEISTSTDTEISTSTEELIIDEPRLEKDKEDEPKGLWDRIVQKLEEKIEKSVETSEKMKSESTGFKSKMEGFQKKFEGFLKRLNNDPV